jgi:hypothetical protein
VQVHARGGARIDGPQSFELTKPSLTLEVRQGGTSDALTIALDAPVVHYAASTLRADTPQVLIRSDAHSHLQMSGSLAAQSVTVVERDAVSITRPTFTLDLEGANVPGGRARIDAQTPALAARLETQTLSAEDVTIDAGALKLQASISGTAILDAPRLVGQLTLASFSPRKLLESAGQSLEGDPAAFAQADLGAQYELSATGLRLHDVKLTIDDTHITGEIALSDFAPPTVRFDLAADRLALDRYAATGTLVPARAGSGFELSSEALTALDA